MGSQDSRKKERKKRETFIRPEGIKFPVPRYDRRFNKKPEGRN